MERKFNVKLVRTYKYCLKCTGMMVQCTWGSMSITDTTGTFALTQFNHKCDKCGHGESYDRNYPILEYIDDGELE